MTLTADYSIKRFVVKHDNGTTEVFQTRAAAVAMYPQLGQPVVVKQDRKRDRRERAEMGDMRDKQGRWM